MNNYRITLCRYLLLLGLSVSLPSLASGGGSGPAEGVNYIAISPPLVVNYGGPGKARFIRAEFSLRAENAADTTEIMHHLPLIRDKLISILSAQSEEVISSFEGKEKLRTHALAEINKALHIATYGTDEHADEAQPSAKKHDDDKKTGAKKDKKKSSETETKAEHEKPAGPASDLLFNNFVVQK